MQIEAGLTQLFARALPLLDRIPKTLMERGIKSPYDQRKGFSGNSHFCCFPIRCFGHRIFDVPICYAESGGDYERRSNRFFGANTCRGIDSIDSKRLERKKKR